MNPFAKLPFVLFVTCLFAAACKEETPPVPKEKSPTNDFSIVKPLVLPKQLPLAESMLERMKELTNKQLEMPDSPLSLQLRAAQLVELDAQITKAKEQLAKKNADAARAALTSALKKKPNDGRMNLLLAEAAGLKNDSPAAERAALTAAVRDLDPAVAAKAAALLGKLAEQLKATDLGRAWFLESLRLKSTPGLDAKMNKGKAAGKDTHNEPHQIGFSVAPLGPAKDLETLCPLLERAFLVPDSNESKCELDILSKPIKASAGPLEEAAIVSIATADAMQHHIVALKTAKGWFATAELAHSSSLESIFASVDKLIVLKLAFEQVVPGEAEELVVEFSQVVDDSDILMNERVKIERRELLVCGLRKGVPACGLRVPLSIKREVSLYSEIFESQRAKKEHSADLGKQLQFGLKVEFDGKGNAVVFAVEGAPPAQNQPLLGSRPVL